MSLHRIVPLTSLLGVCAFCAAAASAGGHDATIEAARESLARRLNVPLEQVQLLSETPMSWPDSNLGCVRIGVTVEEIVTKGTRLILFAEGQEHYYHARPGEDYRYCVTPATKKRGPIGPPVQ